MIQVGDTAPDFALKDNRGREVRLTDYKGKRVLLSWHPLAWTSVCAEQMKALSVDSVPCKNAWAKELGVADTKLRTDFWPHGGVAISYGLFREEQGFAERAKVILDENGEVIFLQTYDIPKLPDIAEIIQFLKT
jgi:peroxiredoxin